MNHGFPQGFLPIITHLKPLHSLIQVSKVTRHHLGYLFQFLFLPSNTYCGQFGNYTYKGENKIHVQSEKPKLCTSHTFFYSFTHTQTHTHKHLKLKMQAFILLFQLDHKYVFKSLIFKKITYMTYNIHIIPVTWKLRDYILKKKMLNLQHSKQCPANSRCSISLSWIDKWKNMSGWMVFPLKESNAKLDNYKLLQESGISEAGFIIMTFWVQNIQDEPGNEIVLTHFSTHSWASFYILKFCILILNQTRTENIQGKKKCIYTEHWHTDILLFLSLCPTQSSLGTSTQYFHHISYYKWCIDEVGKRTLCKGYRQILHHFTYEHLRRLAPLGFLEPISWGHWGTTLFILHETQTRHLLQLDN